MNFIAPVAEICDDIGREETRITASGIGVKVGNVKESKQCIFKTFHQLHFIKKQIIYLFVFDECGNILDASIRIAKVVTTPIVKYNFDDVGLGSVGLRHYFVPLQQYEKNRYDKKTRNRHR